MAVSQDVQDAITTAVTAATTAAMDLQTEALKAANGRGKMPDQLIEVDELDSAGKPTGNKIKVSTITGKPPKNSMDIYEEQKGAPAEQPDWNWNPSAGADAIPVKTPQQIADEEAVRKEAAAKAEQARKEFEENMANIWTPNPQDAVPPAPTPKRDNPYQDPYAAPDFALLADPVTKEIPAIQPRDPFTAKWIVKGGSGLSAESTDSAAAAASAWNTLIANWPKP